MPKIIENVRGRLIDEARKQINENGYGSVTIRSIAKGCEIGLGTFYNYFKSKDLLIATFLLEDWKKRIDSINEATEGSSNPMSAVKNICAELNEFIESNIAIFSAPEAIKSFNGVSSNYHKLLRFQIAQPIYNACVIGGYENPEFLSQFVAEATLTWTVAKKSYEELASVLTKLFIK